MSLLRPVIANTHPPEYSVHKYWARKPANVLSAHVAALLPTPGLVVDPFCGSGVLLCEASRLGHDVVGADVNPIAARLSEFCLDPPRRGDFVAAAEGLLDQVLPSITEAFEGIQAGSKASATRYVVHAIVVLCSGCGMSVSAIEARRSGRAYNCPRCSRRLRFNRQAMSHTQVIQVVTDSGKVTDQEELARQALLSDAPIPEVDISPFNRAFVENPRTLTFAGMTTAHLFTPRNMSCLAMVAAKVDVVGDESIRRALQLMLTSAAASCSRLIAYRDGMTGGGPAWSVPGFWVPPVHLETNPVNHLRARAKKFARALEALEAGPPRRGTRVVHTADATVVLEALADSNKRADLIFLDPPYGDSVPYLEFSAIWNAFLRQSPEVSLDISVSDRKGENGGWARYRESLAAVMLAAAKALKPEGRILVTFNNHDERAWGALVAGLQGAGFGCVDVSYQIPAVVPAKAQFSPNGSYLGDLYSVYQATDTAPMPIHQVQERIFAALQRCASARGGLVARNLAIRTGMLELMRLNVRAADFSVLNEWLGKWFVAETDHMEWREALDPTVPSLDVAVSRITSMEMRGRDRVSWPELAPKLIGGLEAFGCPDVVELKALLSSSFEVQDGTVSRTPEMPPLF